MNLYIGWKPIPMKTLIHKNLFCSNKLYYCSVSSPNRTIIKNISNRLQITLICKCFRACVLLFIKTLFPHHIISYQSYYNRHQVLSIFINMIRILGVITAEFSSNDSYRHKKFSQICIVTVFSLAPIRQSFNFLQMFICWHYFNTVPETKFSSTCQF